ncbi:MAG: hypothetical protein AB7K04_11790 [Pseudorhodoplanes sp.]
MSAAIAQLRAQLQAAETERARHRAAYEPLIGSDAPRYFGAVYSYAVADLLCWRLEEQVRARTAKARGRVSTTRIWRDGHH